MKNHSRIKAASLSLALAISQLPWSVQANEKAAVVTQAKTPASRTITSFTQALRCMDELFAAYDKHDIVVTSGGIQDETGKVRVGTKEMVISAISKMSLKSKAFRFIDMHNVTSIGVADDLANLFSRTNQNFAIPDYYIRGSITQLDENALDSQKGFSIALPFMDFGMSKDQVSSLLTIDMSVGESQSRMILPETNTSNTLVISRAGNSNEAGGRLGKAGISFNLSFNRSEGLGSGTRTLIELGLIETLGRFTQVPYWKCLEIDSTNPSMIQQGREWYDTMTDKDKILFIKRKLAGIGRYQGPINDQWDDVLRDAVSEYQASARLIADGRISFDLYYSLLDDEQNKLVAIPVQPKPAAAPLPASVAPAPVGGGSGGPFQMRLDTDRGAAPNYRVRDVLKLSLSLNNNGQAFCFYEDVRQQTARVFPNRFQASASLRPNQMLQIPGQSAPFRIQFDSPGRERLGCVASDREMLVPAVLQGKADLTPLPVRSLDEVLTLFKQSNPAAVTQILNLNVAP